MPVAYQRGRFFAAVRQHFGALTQSQVEGFEAVLAEAERRAMDERATAYVLATAWWESAHKMQPVPEIGRGKGKPYGVADPETRQVYYGRGLVQITWKANYAKLGKLLGIDLVSHPNLALDMDVAVSILFEGMVGGLFTGKKLADYVNASRTDFAGARHIVNGTDHANDIAKIAANFRTGLLVMPAPDTPLSAPAPVAAKPAPAPAAAAPAHPAAAAKAPTMADTSTNALAAAHPKIAAALPGVDVLAGVENLGKNIIAQLTAGAKAITNPAIPSVTGQPGSSNFFGTLENVKAAAGKVAEIIADAKAKDVREGVADGADLLKIIFATLDTFKIVVPVLSTVVENLPDLHAAKAA